MGSDVHRKIGNRETAEGLSNDSPLLIHPSMERETDILPTNDGNSEFVFQLIGKYNRLESRVVTAAIMAVNVWDGPLFERLDEQGNEVGELLILETNLSCTNVP